MSLRGACDRPVMEGKVKVGGIKAPATRLKRRDLVTKKAKLEYVGNTFT
jgi:hypothetical protein